MRRTFALAVVGLIAGGLVTPAHADYVDCGGEETEIQTAAGLLYVSVITPELLNDPIPMVFIYMESNGVTGLQRGGDAPGGIVGDECPNANPDTFVA